MTPLESPATKTTWSDALAVYLKPRVLIVILLGFSSGLPLALSGATLAIWMTESGVNLRTIGLYALVGLPYTLKFLWAPLVDALDIPFLSRTLGRRRGWLIFSQILLTAAILFLAIQNPSVSLWPVALGAVMVATASATQDIVIDDFRVESLDTSEQAAGMAGYVAAYRIGMLASGAGVIALAAWLEYIGVSHETVWMWGFFAAAALMIIGIFASLLATEPEAPADVIDKKRDPISRVVLTAVESFTEFLTRPLAIAVLLFVLLFKFCDAFAGVLTGPFIIDIGFDKATYAAVVKGVGLASALIGGFAGGIVARALPLSTSLWVGGILQTVSNLAFAWLALIGPSVPALTVAVIFENFTGAIGTVIFVAYLSALCGVRAHTATQFALLTALAAVGRTTLSSGGGFVAESTGWFWFFVISALVAIPSFILLAWLQAKGHFVELDKRDKG